MIVLGCLAVIVGAVLGVTAGLILAFVYLFHRLPW